MTWFLWARTVGAFASTLAFFIASRRGLVTFRPICAALTIMSFIYGITYLGFAITEGSKVWTTAVRGVSTAFWAGFFFIGLTMINVQNTSVKKIEHIVEELEQKRDS